MGDTAIRNICKSYVKRTDDGNVMLTLAAQRTPQCAVSIIWSESDAHSMAAQLTRAANGEGEYR